MLGDRNCEPVSPVLTLGFGGAPSCELIFARTCWRSTLNRRGVLGCPFERRATALADINAYNSTSFDWERIHAYARRVARATPLPRSPAWQYRSTRLIRTVESPATRGFLGFGARPEKISTVSRSTSETILGEHWVIDRRSWHRRETSRFSGTRVEENDGEEYVYALLATGELTVGILKTNEVWNYSPQGGASLVVHPTSTHRVVDLDEHFAGTLDFEKRWRDGSMSGRPTYSWGDRDPGARVIRHSKGVGLTLALKDILDGRVRA